MRRLTKVQQRVLDRLREGERIMWERQVVKLQWGDKRGETYRYTYRWEFGYQGERERVDPRTIDALVRRDGLVDWWVSGYVVAAGTERSFRLP